MDEGKQYRSGDTVSFIGTKIKKFRVQSFKFQVPSFEFRVIDLALYDFAYLDLHYEDYA